MGNLIELKTSSNQLFYAYEAKHDDKNALLMYKEYITLRDTMTNTENRKSVLQKEYEYKYEKNRLIDNLNHERKQNIQRVELTLKQNEINNKQKQQYILYIGLSIVIGLLIIIYNRYREVSFQKQTIINQKALIEETHAKLEEKSREISDSINYAQRIQKSLLASEIIFKSSVKDYFILFKPKDVVSGDFYWANTIDNKLFVCVADSTGHGIPGALMSMLNISLLNEALFSRKYLLTKDILNFVRDILKKAILPDENGHGGNDGMDCSMISIDLNTMALEYTGANNPLWIIRDNEIIEFKPNKMPVGRSPHEEISFMSSYFNLVKNDQIILFTDGFADQFGGDRGKKFKYKPMEKMFLEFKEDFFKTQKEKILTVFNSWKGELEQVDDVCILSFKI